MVIACPTLEENIAEERNKLNVFVVEELDGTDEGERPEAERDQKSNKRKSQSTTSKRIKHHQALENLTESIAERLR
ncbi:hypothetical protein F2Q70_00005847 [Brassica cretica]|uniref:Uncharacterized protein n=1 Tax=Brassica cretica TaxID=69181 RepID=A0A8S9ISE1_BRACR|nr:hypothetical protein F2Q70_00005847 [Brassica cretica]